MILIVHTKYFYQPHYILTPFSISWTNHYHYQSQLFIYKFWPTIKSQSSNEINKYLQIKWLRKDDKMQKSPIFKWWSRLEINIWEWVLSESGSLVGSVVMAHVDDVVERSPSDNGSFLVPEPFGCNSWDVGVIHVWNSWGDFCSWNDSVKVWNLTGVSDRMLHWVVSL